ncbi:MAG: SRPBCC family protein [Saprospiraceae bacterium]|nr:SRPBCC family protein [Saprospiraceae bacterium]HMW38493.1 SRPBCC family protein [Saprospiraceae bacterium]HMX88372.1 SRPBCC family protein [Saprospiraceae bacterium]HMZ40264.1 SRPBCC family protein [Saprospiraceae bacterium]HNA65554.1 SRPBCC family protein [Saprospiraceae bacterium]
MATIYNEIKVNASIDKVWSTLTDLELLDRYDPTVMKSTLLSTEKSGIGAKRKVMMKDGKNWFEEKITIFKPNESLTYQLTDCSFPIQGLKHSYSFEKIGNQTKIMQVMEYTVKFGLLGKLLDRLMIRNQSDIGIKKFFAGLKSYAETH